MLDADGAALMLRVIREATLEVAFSIFSEEDVPSHTRAGLIDGALSGIEGLLRAPNYEFQALDNDMAEYLASKGVTSTSDLIPLLMAEHKGAEALSAFMDLPFDETNENEITRRDRVSSILEQLRASTNEAGDEAVGVFSL